MGSGTPQQIHSPRNCEFEFSLSNSLDRMAWMQNSDKHNLRNPLGAPPQDVRRGRVVLALADFFEFRLGDSGLKPKASG